MVRHTYTIHCVAGSLRIAMTSLRMDPAVPGNFPNRSAERKTASSMTKSASLNTQTNCLLNKPLEHVGCLQLISQITLRKQRKARLRPFLDGATARPIYKIGSKGYRKVDRTIVTAFPLSGCAEAPFLRFRFQNQNSEL